MSAKSDKAATAVSLLRNKWLWLGVLLVVALGWWAGRFYYRRSSIENLLQEQIQTSNELVDVLQSIEDEEDMKSAWPKIVELHKTQDELAARFRGYSAPTDRELSQWDDEVAEIQMLFRLQLDAITQIKKQVPGGEKFVRKLSSLRSNQTSLIVNEGIVP